MVGEVLSSNASFLERIGIANALYAAAGGARQAPQGGVGEGLNSIFMPKKMMAYEANEASSPGWRVKSPVDS